MPEPAEEITDKVDQQFIDTQEWRDRLDADYDRWSNVPYTGAGPGYHNYTSNDARNYAAKIIAMVAGAVMNIRILQENDPRSARERDNAKERFLIGGLRANDERLHRLDLVPLRAAMTWFAALRGRTFGRCMLINDRRGARMDATYWDPRWVTWEMGPDGLEWICNKRRVTRAYAERAWRKEIKGDGPPTEELDQYDYYDRERNAVIIPDLANASKWAKPPTLHGLEDQVPAWTGTVATEPMIVTEDRRLSSSMVNYGESVYANNRLIWDHYNFLVSSLEELAARARKPLIIVKSPDGLRVLEFDPYKEGAVLSLPNNCEIMTDLMTAGPDLAPMIALISGEMQRGGLPLIMYGDSPLAISGYAMNTLRGSVADKILPIARLEEMVHKQIANVWADHFMTGAFDGMQLSGQGNNRRWFSELITPDMIRDLPEPVITIRPQMPQDDMAKIQMAMALRSPGPDGRPLISDPRILEEWLEVQDSDLETDAVIQQMAQTAHPEAQLYTYWNALAERGDERALIYFSEWMQLQLQKAQGAPMERTRILGLGGGGPGGVSPEVAPNAVLGNPPPSPTPQAGPLVEAGRPRPGANGTRQGTLL